MNYRSFVRPMGRVLTTLLMMLAGACTLEPTITNTNVEQPQQVNVINSAQARENYYRSLLDETALSPHAGGYYLDVQTARLQGLAQQGVLVRRLPERVQITIPGSDSFTTGSSRLTPSAENMLGALASVLVEFKQSLVVVGGHSDGQGEPQYNLWLSRERALAVADFLRAAGVPREKLLARGFGDTQPVADNSTDIGRANNRRIELNLWPLLTMQP